jgi:UPF0716 family protein affecting phage T7 exclusion
MEAGLGGNAAPGQLLLEVMLLNVAKVLFLWPGPLSTLLAILLLLPLFRTLLIRLVILRWMSQFFKTTMSGPAPGVQIHFGSHWASTWGSGPAKDGLKTVQGEDWGSQPLDQHELDGPQEGAKGQK